MSLARISSPFLEGLTSSDRKIVLGAARQQRFLAKSIVINQGNPANHLFLLTEGRARYFYITDEGKKIILIWIAPGETFGGRTLLSKQSSYLCSVETVENSRALVWPRTTIRALAMRCPKVLENIFTIASNYLDWCLATELALISDPARQRLSQILVNLSRDIGREVDDGIELEVTNEELANAAHITPFTASRLLSEWQRCGVLIKNRGKLLLRSPDQLFIREI